MAKWRVACLEKWEQAVEDAVRAVAPPDFDLVFVGANDDGERAALAADADFLLVVSASAPVIEAAKKARLIQKWGIGVDKVDLEAARAKGVPVAITAGGNANAVAEHAIMLMLAVYRRLAYVDAGMRIGEWRRAEMRSTALQLRGRTVGLYGLGNIGRMVARKLSGFEVSILYYDMRRADPDEERQLGVTFVEPDRLLAESEILSLHVPYVKATHHLIDRETIAAMRDGAVIVNTARGELIDDAALVEAIESGKLFGAGLDAFAPEPLRADSPLLPLKQVVLTPHTGGGVFDNVPHVARHCFDNMRRVIDGQPLPPADIVVPAP